MLVHIPWKEAFFPLRPHQINEIEHDSKGPFLRVRNAQTNRLNKCRVYTTSSSPKKSPPKTTSPKKSPKITSPNKSPKMISPNKQSSLEDLVGKRVSGTVAQTGPNYFALLVEHIESIPSSSLGTQLVQMARQYLKDRNVTWKVNTPRSWTIPVSPQRQLGPHVSLSSIHLKDVHKQFTLTIVRVMHWEENSRWVALKLKGPLIDHTNWILHLSCAQQIL